MSVSDGDENSAPLHLGVVDDDVDHGQVLHHREVNPGPGEELS